MRIIMLLIIFSTLFPPVQQLDASLLCCKKKKKPTKPPLPLNNIPSNSLTDNNGKTEIYTALKKPVIAQNILVTFELNNVCNNKDAVLSEDALDILHKNIPKKIYAEIFTASTKGVTVADKYKSVILQIVQALSIIQEDNEVEIIHNEEQKTNEEDDYDADTEDGSEEGFNVVIERIINKGQTSTNIDDIPQPSQLKKTETYLPPATTEQEEHNNTTTPPCSPQSTNNDAHVSSDTTYISPGSNPRKQSVKRASV